MTVGTHDRHARALLHGVFFRTRKVGERQNHALDRVFGILIVIYVLGKVRDARSRTDAGDDRAALDIVGAEFSAVFEPALDVRYIIVIPQFPHDFGIELKCHLSVFHFENRFTELFTAYEHIIGEGVPSEKGFAAAPCVILFRQLRNAFPCGKLFNVGAVFSENLSSRSC